MSHIRVLQLVAPSGRYSYPAGAEAVAPPELSLVGLVPVGDAVLYYVVRNELTALVVTPAATRKAWALQVCDSLLLSHAEWVERSDPERVLFDEVLATVARTAEAEYGKDALGATEEELAAVRALMSENVEQVLGRGERLQTLVNKTDRINNSSGAFRRRTGQARRRAWWASAKAWVMGGVAAGGVLVVAALEVVKG